jgi:hypothetical protein
VATGAAVGAASRSRAQAVLAGAVSHFVGDRVPHQDLPSRRFEIGSGLALLGLLAVARGSLDSAIVGACAGSAPDLEHVLPLPTLGGRKLFPSHRIRGWHRSGGLPAWLQLVAAGAIVGALLRRPARDIVQLDYTE